MNLLRTSSFPYKQNSKPEDCPLKKPCELGFLPLHSSGRSNKSPSDAQLVVSRPRQGLKQINPLMRSIHRANYAYSLGGDLLHPEQKAINPWRLYIYNIYIYVSTYIRLHHRHRASPSHVFANVSCKKGFKHSIINLARSCVLGWSLAVYSWSCWDAKSSCSEKEIPAEFE